MTIADIQGLSAWIEPVIADDCLLLLWATWPNLKDCIATGEAWGFTYRTLGFDWIKIRERGAIHAGMGYYTQANSEPCLLFTRGAVTRRWIKDNGISQVLLEDERQLALPGFDQALIAELKGHSAKPELFYSRVKRLLNGPFLELFARRSQGAGWTCLGDAISGRDIREDLTLWQESKMAL
jgi:N6-adenosine-specific RNA methylase IME4